MWDQQSLRSACSYAQSDQSLCKSLEYSRSVKLLTECHSEFLSLNGDCTVSSESTLVKMPHCWKSHAAAHMSLRSLLCLFLSGHFTQVLLRTVHTLILRPFQMLYQNSGEQVNS